MDAGVAIGRSAQKHSDHSEPTHLHIMVLLRSRSQAHMLTVKVAAGLGV